MHVCTVESAHNPEIVLLRKRHSPLCLSALRIVALLLKKKQQKKSDRMVSLPHPFKRNCSGVAHYIKKEKHDSF